MSGRAGYSKALEVGLQSPDLGSWGPGVGGVHSRCWWGAWLCSWNTGFWVDGRAARLEAPRRPPHHQHLPRAVRAGRSPWGCSWVLLSMWPGHPLPGPAWWACSSCPSTFLRQEVGGGAQPGSEAWKDPTKQTSPTGRGGGTLGCQGEAKQKIQVASPGGHQHRRDRHEVAEGWEGGGGARLGLGGREGGAEPLFWEGMWLPLTPASQGQLTEPGGTSGLPLTPP